MNVHSYLENKNKKNNSRIDVAVVDSIVSKITNDVLVTAMCRLDLPSSIDSKTSSGLETNLSVAPFTNGTLFLSSCTLKFTLETEMRRISIFSMKKQFFFYRLTNPWFYPCRFRSMILLCEIPNFLPLRRCGWRCRLRCGELFLAWQDHLKN